MRDHLKDPASWVVREKATKRALFETYDQRKVQALNTDRYEAIPIMLYLEELNRKIRLSRSIA